MTVIKIETSLELRTGDSLDVVLPRIKKLIGQSALNEYRVAQFISELSRDWQRYQDQAEGKTCNQWLLENKLHSIEYWQIRIRAECCFGNGGNEKSVRRIIEPTAAIFVMNNITDKQKLKALLEHSARIARETAMPISRGEMMRLAEQLVGIQGTKASVSRMRTKTGSYQRDALTKREAYGRSSEAAERVGTVKHKVSSEHPQPTKTLPTIETSRNNEDTKTH